uniref:Uncharacterized protein n=1 Tax=Setaria viridis TaxID=4556 RepID=A0A4U6VTX4_SETVI|nr:hypothetical protein SEVIR_3G321900v2 [Setaria viridis]
MAAKHLSINKDMMFVGRGRRIGWQSCRSMMNSLRSPDMPCKLSRTLSISSTPPSGHDKMFLVAIRTRFTGLNTDKVKAWGGATLLPPCSSSSSSCSPLLIVSSKYRPWHSPSMSSESH